VEVIHFTVVQVAIGLCSSTLIEAEAMAPRKASQIFNLIPGLISMVGDDK
jgi:hypothetical protein